MTPVCLCCILLFQLTLIVVGVTVMQCLAATESLLLQLLLLPEYFSCYSTRASCLLPHTSFQATAHLPPLVSGIWHISLQWAKLLANFHLYSLQSLLKVIQPAACNYFCSSGLGSGREKMSAQVPALGAQIISAAPQSQNPHPMAKPLRRSMGN